MIFRRSVRTLLTLTCCMMFHAFSAYATEDGWDRSKISSATTQEPYKVLFYGDSIFSGYGLGDPQGSVVNVIKETFSKDIYVDRGVIYADLSHEGETTSNAVTRIKQAIAMKPDVIILALGTNDARNGTDPDIIYNNLDTILKDLARSGIYTLFVGMQANTANGYDYLSKFNSVYPKLAETYSVVFLPFLKEGVAGNRMLNQRDAIHPNADGAKVIAAHVSESLKRMLGTLGTTRKNLKDLEYQQNYHRMMNESRAKQGLPPLPFP